MAYPNPEGLQIDYTQNKFIQQSYIHYMKLNPKDKELINAYKAEMDASDWADKPLDITYTVINWILYRLRSTPMRNMPNLLTDRALTKEQFVNQIIHAKRLVDILSTFPKITEGVNNIGIPNHITVFRGETAKLGKFIKRQNKETSIYSFLSTTMNLEVAAAFNKGILLVIHIPANKPLPFISDHLSLNYRKGTSSSESEVLLPPGSTFQINGYVDNATVFGKNCDVIYLTLIQFGPDDSMWKNLNKNANALYNTLYSEKMNIDDQPQNSSQPKKRRTSHGRSHKKQNKSRKNKI